VLVLTGDPCEETEAAAACCGVDDYLVKDYISGALLVQAIHSVCYVRGHKRLSTITAYHLIHRFRWKFEL
jgi:DNA-binding NarL/FixJ family response regulator